MNRSFQRATRQRHPSRPTADLLFRRAPVAAAVATWAMLGCGEVFAQQAAPAPAAPASAASGATQGEAPALDAVTVHSRNRIERLQDVPISVSVTTGAELARLDAYGVDAITKRAANVSWNQGNQRTSSLSIRGIGKIGQTEAQDPSVGVIVDGVSYAYNALTSSFDFVDVDTVEVARGPQGTLQGKNASVGSISVNYKRPSFTPTADYTLAFEKTNGLLGVGAIGGPIVDDLLAWRGTFVVERKPGVLVNAYNRDQQYTNTDRVSGRVQFLLTPTDALKVRLEGDVTPRGSETTNGAVYNRPSAFTKYTDGSPLNTSNTPQTKLSRSWFTQNTGYSVANNYYNGPDNDAQHGLVSGNSGGALEVNYKLPEGTTLTSITAARSYHFDAVNDDGTPFDITRNSGGFWNDYRQKSEELRITSPSGGFVDYQAGLFLMQVKNSATYNKAWGLDGGAYYASPGQYSTLDADAPGQLLMQNSLSNLQMAYNSPSGLQLIDNKSEAIYAQANWHLTDKFTVTTGARLTHEDRQSTDSSYIISNGNGAALNPSSINGVQLGGFNSNATTGVLGTNTADQVALANSVAQQYFGVSSYNALSAGQQKQVAAAKALRAGQIGVLFNPVQAQRFTKNQPAFVLSPSYKFTPDVTGYFSYQHGEKAGISQVVNGISALVQPEKTNAFELGIKTALLNKTLVLNADIFDMRIHDYQQAVSVVDQYSTNLQNLGVSPSDPAYKFVYVSATGNVPKVDTRGLEIDGVYAGIPRTTLRFSGAYTLARYLDFPNSAQPVENAYANAPAFRDVSGKVLAGAPRVSFNVGGDYWQPLTADKDGHVDFNVAYTDKFNSDVALSQYAVVGRGVVTDFSFGVGKHDKSFDASFIVKNLFGNQTPTAVTATSVTPSQPRTWAVQFTGRL